MSDDDLRPLNRRLRVAILSVVALLAVVAVVVTSGSPSNKAATTSVTTALSTPATGGKPTASDQGVTAHQVKIATFTIAQAFLDRYGYNNPNIDKSVAAYANDINAHGGINSRSWVPDLIEVSDPTDPSAVAQACRVAFADHKDFAVVNALAFPGLAECAAKYGRVATDLGYGGVTAASAKLLDSLDGHYWIGGMTTDRFTQLWAKYLAKAVGPSTRVAIIQRDDAQLSLAREQLSAALVGLGFTKPLVITTAPDAATAAIQITDGVAKLKAERVQLLVTMVPAVVVGIIQHGFTNSGFRPSKGFSFSTINGLDSADVTKFYVPEQMDGATGISLYHGPTESSQKTCREVYEAAEPTFAFQQSNADLCHMITQLANAMRAAGTDLTSASLIKGYGALGSYQGNTLGAETYSPTKRDGADQVRVLEFHDAKIRTSGSFRSDF